MEMQFVTATVDTPDVGANNVSQVSLEIHCCQADRAQLNNKDHHVAILEERCVNTSMDDASAKST